MLHSLLASSALHEYCSSCATCADVSRIVSTASCIYHSPSRALSVRVAESLNLRPTTRPSHVVQAILVSCWPNYSPHRGGYPIFTTPSAIPRQQPTDSPIGRSPAGKMKRKFSFDIPRLVRTCRDPEKVPTDWLQSLIYRAENWTL